MHFTPSYKCVNLCVHVCLQHKFKMFNGTSTILLNKHVQVPSGEGEDGYILGVEEGSEKEYNINHLHVHHSCMHMYLVTWKMVQIYPPPLQ